MDQLQKIKTKLNEIAEKRKQLVQDLQADFPGLIVPLMQMDSSIERISWSQYTPYFNDGDECIFRVNNEDIEVNGKDLYELEGYESKYGRNRTGKESNNLEKTIDAIVDVLTDIPENLYKDLFGDHVEVTVFNDGRIEVTEYEHD